MPYAGKTMMLRDVIEIGVHAKGRDDVTPFAQRKVEHGAVVGGESGGSNGAWHDNFSVDGLRAMFLNQPEMLEGKTVSDALVEHTQRHAVGELLSRDCGLGQINILANKVGTSVEASLRSESLEPNIYLPVARNNIAAMADLYTEPWTFPDGKHENRQWQAWVAYLTGWALYPKSWVWSRVVENTWVATGRFLHKSLRATGNWWIVYGGASPEWALRETARLAAIYGVTDGIWFLDTNQLIAYKYPPKPTAPGSEADYPVRNDGRSYLSVWASK